MKISLRNLLCASVAIAPFAFAAPAMAADQTAAAPATTLEEVVVVAQRRSENLQIVPIAVTAVSGKDLEAQNIKSVEDMTTLVSGFTGPGDNGMSSPHLRGIGGTVESPGEERSVAIYVDGIYIGAASAAMLTLSDVSEIEVLKGPQGTLFGRNTTGGLINITTRNPTATPELDTELSYASYNTISGSAYANTSVAPGINTNLAVQALTQGQGYGKDILTGAPTYQTKIDMAVHNKWDFQVSDTAKLSVEGDYELRNDGGLSYRPITGSTTYYGPGPNGSYTSNVTGWNTNTALTSTDHTEAYGLSGRLSQDLGFATLTDTLAYRRTRFELLGFGDTTPLQHLQVYWHTANSQWTNELQLASNASGPLKWTTGLFYYHAVDDTTQPIHFTPGSPGNPPFSEATTYDRLITQSVAGYVQGDYKITPATTLTAGFRYSEDYHSIAGDQIGQFGPALVPLVPQFSESFSRSAAVWRLALSQQLNDDAMVYASYNRGVKAGGYNPVVETNKPFTDEQLDAFELGSKLNFWDHKARLNLAAFFDEYKNIQVQAFQPAGPPIIYNGAGAQTYGLDVDMELRPIEQLTINGTMEALHTAFTSFPDANILIPQPQGGYLSTTGSAKGNQLPFAPNFSSSLSGVYRVPVSYGSFSLSGTWSYSSGFTTTPGMEVKQAPFDMFSAQLQFTDPAERYYVRVWGKNLGNAQVDENLTISANGSTVGLIAPRTVGVTLGMKFK